MGNFLLTKIEALAPTKISDANLAPRGKVHYSPAAWRDQIIYFLLPDRFSDGKENDRPLFDFLTPQTYRADKKQWMEDGKTFRGGTLNGIKSKLQYLKGLGITSIWIGPIYKQRIDMETYHGYAIQNFLDVDPRFGSRQDLRDLTDAAHETGLYVILDAIYNHTGNNWFYAEQTGADIYKNIPYRFSPSYDFGKWRSRNGTQTDRIVDSEDGVWPEDFQNVDFYTRAGEIGRWDPDLSWEDPKNDDCEFRRGDFGDLKDLNHRFDNNRVLNDLIKVYQYWIALADIDGLRIDTVKHTAIDATRNFCGAIREYAESIGKNNFLLIGEVAGGPGMVYNYLDKSVTSDLDMFGRNLDAALDIGEPERRLTNLVLGYGQPKEDFFDQFGGVDELGSHRLTGQYHVSLSDEHDKIGLEKSRICALSNAQDKNQQVASAVGVQLTTLGIPCIYYGTEQAFNGSVKQHDESYEHRFNGQIPYEDRYLRECMFGKTFGSYETQGCHFFNKNHPTYVRIAAIARVRNRKDPIGIAIRRGRQYLREIADSSNSSFRVPHAGDIVPWSRVLANIDVIIALNTNGKVPQNASVFLDSRFHDKNSQIVFLYRGGWSDNQLQNTPPVEQVSVQYVGNTAMFPIDLAPAEMAILVDQRTLA